MRWTACGAHLLLQVRTRVLNDQLAGDFRHRYPGLNRAPDPAAFAAYPPLCTALLLNVTVQESID